MHQGCKARDIGGEELHRDQGVCGHKLKQGAGGSRQLTFELILRPCLAVYHMGYGSPSFVQLFSRQSYCPLPFCVEVLLIIWNISHLRK